tara:strand:+ start:365 stop:1240 length:876 start_codon:yes stop_codon:yes gene_type:complete
MPVYNVENYLSAAIESILTQTFTDFELIVIDDGSTDKSLEILEQYTALDERVKLFKQENRGISYTRNRLLSLAQSEYIAWMDSDDISLPQRLETQLQYLKCYDDVLAVGSFTILTDKENNDLCLWKVPVSHEEIDGRHIKGVGGAIVFPSSMMRKTIVEKVGGFDDSLIGAEDLNLFLKLAEKGKLANLDCVLYRYRQHIQSISYNSRTQIVKDTLYTIEQAHQRRNLEYVPISIHDKNDDREDVVFNRWSWWALRHGNIRTSRKYAMKACINRPLNISYWKTLFCTIRGY